MTQEFAGIYHNLPVLITGHTGFKGSWLTNWLLDLGAHVIGYSLTADPTRPSNYNLSYLSEAIIDVRGDIRDLETLRHTIATHRPRLIFHLAAQPIVIHGYRQPHDTFDINAGGTVNLLEAIRTTDCVDALVSITTDKVYANQEWLWGYRESDRLGGHDPYSASKAMAELALAAYRHSYFQPGSGQRPVAVASVRAGNVIGGGDFAAYRLVPDCLRALMAGDPIAVRHPASVRPWQHVLEPLSGYLWLGARLLQEGDAFADAWNFGPLEQTGVTTRAIAEKLIALWGSGRWEHTGTDIAAPETGLLRLSWEKAALRLGWRPVYTWEEALTEIVAWFRAYESGADLQAVGRQHIRAYTTHARTLALPWT